MLKSWASPTVSRNQSTQLRIDVVDLARRVLNGTATNVFSTAVAYGYCAWRIVLPSRIAYSIYVQIGLGLPTLNEPFPPFLFHFPRSTGYDQSIRQASFYLNWYFYRYYDKGQPPVSIYI